MGNFPCLPFRTVVEINGRALTLGPVLGEGGFSTVILCSGGGRE